MFNIKPLSLLVGMLCFLAAIQTHAQEKSPEIIVDGKSYYSTQEAQKAIKDSSNVYLSDGEYHQGLKIDASNVTLSGTAKTRFIGAAIEGKATFVVSGDNVIIENVECSLVEVSSKNGACVRQQGKNLTLKNVYFHDSEQGILQSDSTGDLTIEFSKFERLGKAGRAHAVYANGDTLMIRYSQFLNSVDQGHEIKSRSKRTIIEDCVIASLDGNDSRLIDISNGGELVIKNTVLQQGVNTVNRQLIGFGLEKLGRTRGHSITITNNIFIMERPNGNEFLALEKHPIKPIQQVIEGNIFVGSFIDKEYYLPKNLFFDNRHAAYFKENELPDISTITVLKSLQ